MPFRLATGHQRSLSRERVTEDTDSTVQLSFPVDAPQLAKAVGAEGAFGCAVWKETSFISVNSPCVGVEASVEY
ncbi:hypothetical protein CEXT_421431 [Caerostris extrusa]|uniref:Uncharacterized protein n=1 Tax=Caerostris extrusa TaxID=172846 RepID=A0AAV4S370_CAEEX|nr:hypothetical protein CEXT_421431 [Caerostris extrusa]